MGLIQTSIDFGSQVPSPEEILNGIKKVSRMDLAIKSDAPEDLEAKDYVFSVYHKSYPQLEVTIECFKDKNSKHHRITVRMFSLEPPTLYKHTIFYLGKHQDCIDTKIDFTAFDEAPLTTAEIEKEILQAEKLTKTVTWAIVPLVLLWIVTAPFWIVLGIIKLPFLYLKLRKQAKKLQLQMQEKGKDIDITSIDSVL